MPTSISPDLGDDNLQASLEQSLEAVEDRLTAAVESVDPFIDQAASYLVRAGGKRFRPMLTVLASHWGDPHAPGVVDSAVVVELTHLATLYHDDVMDEAPQRRGTASANARWDNTIAILTGDFLFARASDILADLGPDAVRIQARTFERLVTGQIHETNGPTDGQDPIDHHIGVLADKTGSLIATACQFGAMFGGCDRETVAALTNFGERIGVAFQLADDIVDIASESGQSGKTPGTDLREGIATLPVLYALQSTDPADAHLQRLVSRPITDDGEHAEALELLRQHSSLGRARETAGEWAGQAREALAPLAPSPQRQALEALCDYVVHRSG